jgi:hypothetical protein
MTIYEIDLGKYENKISIPLIGILSLVLRDKPRFNTRFHPRNAPHVS